MSQKKLVLLTAGGTGGHFFPAIALAEDLELYKHLDIHIATDNRCCKYLTNDIKIKSHVIDLYINLSNITGALKAPFSILLALIKAFITIKRLKPSVIIGFGGYPSFPLMFMGQFLGIPTIIYEQNSFFGKSNKLFAKRAKLIALAYDETKNLPNVATKTIVTGDFIRANIKSLNQKNNFNQKPFTILIIGGSQGAKFFSDLIPNAVTTLIKKHPKIQLNIIQQVGQNDITRVKKIYEGLKINSIISGFFPDIYKHYATCNLVIARSGATTIAELTQIGQPAIFIPLPHASDDHQYYNAKAIETLGGAWCYRQKDIYPELLADKLYELIHNTDLIKTASSSLINRKTHSSKKFIDTALKIIT